MKEKISLQKKYKIEKEGNILNPITTIIIPAYNSYKTIQRALISSLTQDTNFKYNINIVDDGSEKPIKSSIESIFIEDPKVNLFRQKNSGASIALNLAATNTNSKYLIRLDADDELTPNAVQELTNFMEEDSSLVYAYGDGYWIGNLPAWTWTKFSPVKKENKVNPWEKRNYDPDLLLQEMYFGHPRIFRKDKFEEIGGYSKRYLSGQDWDFALKMSEIGKIKRLPRKLHKYYFLSTGLTNTKENERIDWNKKIIDEARRRRNESMY